MGHLQACTVCARRGHRRHAVGSERWQHQPPFLSCHHCPPPPALHPVFPSSHSTDPAQEGSRPPAKDRTGQRSLKGSTPEHVRSHGKLGVPKFYIKTTFTRKAVKHWGLWVLLGDRGCRPSLQWVGIFGMDPETGRMHSWVAGLSPY